MIQTRFRSSCVKSTRRSLRTNLKSSGTCKIGCGVFNRPHRKINGLYTSKRVTSKAKTKVKLFVRKPGKNFKLQLEGKSRIHLKNRAQRVIPTVYRTVRLNNYDQGILKLRNNGGENWPRYDKPSEKQFVVKATFHPSRHPVNCGKRNTRPLELPRRDMYFDELRSDQSRRIEGNLSPTDNKDTGSEFNNLIISDSDQLKMRLPSSAEVRSMRKKMVRRKVDPKIHPQIYQMTRKTNSFLFHHDPKENGGQGGPAAREAGFIFTKDRRQAWSLDNRGFVVSNLDHTSTDGEAFRTASQILKSKRVEENPTKEKSPNVLIPMNAYPVSFYFPLSIENDGASMVRVLTPTPIMIVDDTRWKACHG